MDCLLKHLNLLGYIESISQRVKVNTTFISWDSVTSDSSATLSPSTYAVYIITTMYLLH